GACQVAIHGRVGHDQDRSAHGCSGGRTHRPTSQRKGSGVTGSVREDQRRAFAIGLPHESNGWTGGEQEKVEISVESRFRSSATSRIRAARLADNPSV